MNNLVKLRNRKSGDLFLTTDEAKDTSPSGEIKSMISGYEMAILIFFPASTET